MPQEENKQPDGLFRHFVCRVGGLPASELEELRADDSSALIEELLELEGAMAADRHQITEGLYDQIGKCGDRKVRGALVQIKRDIHNLRLPRTAQLKKASPCLPPHLSQKIEAYLGQGRRCLELSEEFEKAHRREAAAGRRGFQKLVQDPDLRKGLLLSSRSLSRQVQRYAAAEPGNLTKKERQAERSLMRYLSRTCMKATPFSTFCAVIPGQVAENGASPIGFQGNPRRKRSLIRLNKSLYSNLLALLLKHPETRRHFHVELNPTLREAEGKLVFLTALGTREVFQRMPKSPVLELLRGLFRPASHRPLSALIETLCSNPQVEASAEQAEAFVTRLLEVGFIRFRIGIREQEVDWDRPLREILDAMGDEKAARGSQFLKQLRANASAYAAASVSQRRKLLEESVALVESSFKDLAPVQESQEEQAEEEGREQAEQTPEEAREETEAKKERLGDGISLPRSAVRFRNEIPFFEDAGAEACLFIAPRRLQDLQSRLTEYVSLTARLAEPRSAQATMRRFFNQYYQGRRASVPLLEFYEDFYREHFKEHLERMQQPGRRPPVPHPDKDGEAAPKDAEPQEAEKADPEEEAKDAGSDYDLANPLKVELIDHIQQARKALRALLVKRWRGNPDAEAVDLSRADLENALGEVPPGTGSCRSVSMFVQYLPRFSGGHDGLVANTFLTGFGKYFSRFLSLFPEDVEQDLFEQNSRLSSRCLAEICGDAGFNANLHPPLLRWEISYPTGETGPSQIQLSTADLCVQADADDPDALCLRHLPSAKRVIPIDLGFLNPRMRPPLFQLLSRFTPPSAFAFPLPEAPVMEGEKQAKEGQAEAGEIGPRIQVRPRITYRNRLVLARRRWQIPADLYPRREAGQSEADYFLQVGRWRAEHGFPREVFVRVQPLPSPAKKPPVQEQAPDEEAKKQTPAPKQAQRMRRIHYKPQYIDFANPLLVELFGKVAENLQNFRISMEERLPSQDQLLGYHGERYATEFIVQVDFWESAEGEKPQRARSGARRAERRA